MCSIISTSICSLVFDIFLYIWKYWPDGGAREKVYPQQIVWTFNTIILLKTLFLYFDILSHILLLILGVVSHKLVTKAPWSNNLRDQYKRIMESGVNTGKGLSSLTINIFFVLIKTVHGQLTIFSLFIFLIFIALSWLYENLSLRRDAMFR